MNYTKPQIIVLGDAFRRIEHAPPAKIAPKSDSNLVVSTTNPAYDLDE